MKKLYFFLFLFFIFSSGVFAQFTFFNNGAQVFVKQNAIMQVNGNATNSGNNALFQNDGDVTVDNSNLQGDFIITNAANVQGGGVLKVEGGWINNANFTANTSNASRVILNRNDGQKQFITGNSVTTFFDLELQGTSVKQQDTNVFVSDSLILNSSELATDVHTLFFTNTANNAVTNNTAFGSEGFVSSKTPGVLSRATNSISSYLFPTGSSEGITRYRPVEIIPNQSNATTFTARFVNHNADNDGFNKNSNDGVVCITNDTFYHAILGNNPADIKIHFLPSSDGNWINMAHWRTNSINWNDMGSTALGSSGSYTVMTRSSWQFANPGDPYRLTEAKSAPDTIQGLSGICAGEAQTVFSAIPGTADSYTWIISSPSGDDTISGGNQISVDWDTISGTYTVSLVSTSATGCKTFGSVDSAGNSPYTVTIHPLPQAMFDTVSGGFFGDEMSFIDSSIHASQWVWSFGDEDSSFVQNPNHSYTAPGTYEVLLIVTSANGCIDTTYGEITIPEGIFLPNIFTPNGDGKNDFFYIPAMGLGEFHIKIYNRWGNFIWETTAPKIEWDGRNYSGELVPDGSYYFILEAKSPNKDYSTTGSITLTR